MQANARIYFQKAKSKRTKDNLCPAKLCVTHHRNRRYYSLKEVISNNDWLFLSDEDIKKVTGDSPRGVYRDIAFEYDRVVDDAQAIIKDIDTFSFGQFEQKFLKKPTSWDNVFIAIVDHIKSLKIEERFSYALSFESTLRAVKEFHDGKPVSHNCRTNPEKRYSYYLAGQPLNFADITPVWLKRFELHLKKEGKSRSTIGIFVRNLRVLFNIALKVHKIKVEYPFYEHKPKTSEGRKIALTAYQISLIANYKTEDPQAQFYKDVFMFSFLGCGMNLSDIARLRYSNIIDDEIWFVREKTKREEAHEDMLHVPITKNMQSIIERHGNKTIGYDGFIFPVLKPDMTEEQKFMQVRQLTKQLNKYLKQIAGRVGITENVSSYVARHSWATIAKNSGTSTEFISESLGHSSVIVTQLYLKSFEKSTRREHSEKMEKAINNQKAI
jgi:integrase